MRKVIPSAFSRFSIPDTELDSCDPFVLNSVSTRRVSCVSCVSMVTPPVLVVAYGVSLPLSFCLYGRTCRPADSIWTSCPAASGSLMNLNGNPSSLSISPWGPVGLFVYSTWSACCAVSCSPTLLMVPGGFTGVRVKVRGTSAGFDTVPTPPDDHFKPLWLKIIFSERCVSSGKSVVYSIVEYSFI